jgi:hypothetical protein
LNPKGPHKKTSILLIMFFHPLFERPIPIYFAMR